VEIEEESVNAEACVKLKKKEQPTTERNVDAMRASLALLITRNLSAVLNTSLSARIFHPARPFSTSSPRKMSKTVDIKIVSDSICPWCYVGKKNLEQALDASPETQFNVSFKPFFLREGLPKEGVPIQKYLEQVYGKADFKRNNDHLKALGRQVGIEFNDDRLVANTLDSHRLIRYALDKGVQRDVAEQIFKSYFVEGKCISDHQMLADAAASAGLDKEEVLRFLAGDEYKDNVFSEIRDAKSQRISGVPHFIISSPESGQKLELSGAQPKENFIKAFKVISGSNL